MKKRDWLIPAGLIVLSVVPALGGTTRLMQVGRGVATPENARFLAMPIPIILHIVAAMLYSFLGALQFSPGFRKQNRRWHRMAGRVLLPAAVIVAGSGLWMTLNYPWPVNDGLAVFGERLVFGTLMMVSVALGIEALRRRRYAEHGDWMIRAYAIGLGAGTQVLTHLPWFLLVDLKPGYLPRAVMMGLGWVINLAVAEYVIQRKGHETHLHRGHGRRSDALHRPVGVVSPVGARRSIA